MKFGKEFRTHLEETLPDWKDKFLSYKVLKKLLKGISVNRVEVFNEWGNQNHDDVRGENGGAEGHGIGDGALAGLEDWFVGLLDEELEKFNDFYVNKEEEFIIRFQMLKERLERLRQKTTSSSDGAVGSEFSQEMIAIRKDLVTIHGEMVLLQNYSSLNFAGLLKILKKYDKRTGALLTLPFTQRALHQPFFTTEPLTRLVHECEANLELLFPLVAEVVESSSQTPPEQRQGDNNSNDDMAAPRPRDTTMEIYRSTLAAMRTIQGLRRESSTYNPLSFASHFGELDDVGLRAENENSFSGSTVLQNEENQQVSSNPNADPNPSNKAADDTEKR